jgi:hypothetical protein
VEIGRLLGDFEHNFLKSSHLAVQKIQKILFGHLDLTAKKESKKKTSLSKELDSIIKEISNGHDSKYHHTNFESTQDFTEEFISDLARSPLMGRNAITEPLKSIIKGTNLASDPENIRKNVSFKIDHTLEKLDQLIEQDQLEVTNQDMKLSQRM